ncbi:MAG: hypothetical protein Q9204_002374 [Flavoplaca sp. TL-2023a]
MDRISVPPQPPRPLPTHLRTSLTSALLSSSAIPQIQSTLHNTAQEAGWNDAVHRRAKQIISSGKATSLKEVMEILVKEAMEGRGSNSRPVDRIPGGLARPRQEVANSAQEDPAVDVMFPNEAVKKGKEVVRDGLEDLVDIGTS